MRGIALWDEVKDKLNTPALSLSGGSNSDFCIARAIAVEPEVLLMDEPTSALDPMSTAKIEELVRELKERYTVVIVTHNMRQSGKNFRYNRFFLLGELIEVGKTRDIFNSPKDRRTEDYITGRFG